MRKDAFRRDRFPGPGFLRAPGRRSCGNRVPSAVEVPRGDSRREEAANSGERGEKWMILAATCYSVIKLMYSFLSL